MCVLNEIWCLCTLQHFKINHARFTSPSCLLELLRPPGTAPGRPPPPSAPRSPFFSSSPSPPPPASGSRRSVGKETKREERRGREGQSCPSSPREGAGSVWGLPPRELRRVSAPPAAQGGGLEPRGCFHPFPAETSPNSGCFEAPTCGSRGGFYFQARTMLPRTKFVGGGRGERSPPRPGSPANDRGDGLCPSPPAPPSPGGSLQAASVTSPALTGLRLETAEKGIFSLAARLILEFLLPQPLASKPRPARTSAPRQRGEQPPGLSPLSREGGCVEKKR